METTQHSERNIDDYREQEKLILERMNRDFTRLNRIHQRHGTSNIDGTSLQLLKATLERIEQQMEVQDSRRQS